MNLSTIRAGIATQLKTISGLRVYTEWPDTISWPCALIKPATILPHQTFDGGIDVHIEVLLLAYPIQNSLPIAQKALDAYLADSGSSSVMAAIEATGVYTVLPPISDYGPIEIEGGDTAMGCRFDVLVYG